jgi:hypothetical protein
MAKSTKRASERDLNILHRLTVRGLIKEFRRVAKAKEALPAGLLNASSKVLALTGTTTADRTVTKVDRNAALLRGYDETEDLGEAITDFSTPPQRELPERAG